MPDAPDRPKFTFSRVAEGIEEEYKRRSLERARRFIQYGTRQKEMRLLLLPEVFANLRAKRVNHLEEEIWPSVQPLFDEHRFRGRPDTWKILGLIAFEMDIKPSDPFIRAVIIAVHLKTHKIKPKNVAKYTLCLGKSTIEKLCQLARALKNHPRIDKLPRDDLPLELLAMTDSRRLLTVCNLDYRDTNIGGVVNIPASACYMFGFTRYRMVQALEAEGALRTAERYLFQDLVFSGGEVKERSNAPDGGVLFASTYHKQSLPVWLPHGWGDYIRVTLLDGKPDKIKSKGRDGFAPSKADIARILNLEYLDKVT